MVSSVTTLTAQTMSLKPTVSSIRFKSTMLLGTPSQAQIWTSGTAAEYDSGRRWAWQSIPILQLPPVRAGSGLTPLGSDTEGESSKSRPQSSVMAKIDKRILLAKEKSVEHALRAAEEILDKRRREAIGRWANIERDFVKENRCQTSGPPCCRRRKELKEARDTNSRREERRAKAIRSRDARQRFLVAMGATANRGMCRRKSARDRAFAELVYSRIFVRTGGVVRAWTVVIANVNRLKFLIGQQGAVDRAARQHRLELHNNRLAVITRFLSQVILKRRRNKAVKVIVAALSAITNSTAIGRYARRVSWSTRYLQAVARRRMACMSSHLILLSRLWDRLYPPFVSQSFKAATNPPQSAPPAPAPSDPLSDPGDAHLVSAAAPTKGNRNPVRQRKGKPRPKRRQSLASAERKGQDSGGDAGGDIGQAIAAPAGLETSVDTTEGAGAKAEQGRAPTIFVSAKAKHEEILSWLRRARLKYCRDALHYERFTVLPCMVELLLQHEPATYQSRLQAIKHVTALRAFGRLSRVWMENGYFAKMSHVIPPPPRLQRLFSPEEGGEMFTRAVARTAESLLRRDADVSVATAPAATAVEENKARGDLFSMPSETVLIEVESGAAAAAAAAAAGEAAVKIVLVAGGAR